ncbi:2787_t:CDS:1, partial [Dentiscutata heterogama]
DVEPDRLLNGPGPGPVWIDLLKDPIQPWYCSEHIHLESCKRLAHR